MSSRLLEVFQDTKIINRIKERLPYLFQLAEEESSRAGRIGMQVGSVRENIIIALLASIFGIENLDTNIPITEPEVDVRLFGEPISIKTITGSLLGVKLIWTVDAEKAVEFINNYYPECDILLVRIKWMAAGGLFYIPKEVQQAIFNKIGRHKYFKLPKQGTNPRGVEITENALTMAIGDTESKSIPIYWQRSEIEFDPYERWLKLWE